MRQEQGFGIYEPMAEVTLGERETLENALRRFKRKVQEDGIIRDLKEHSYFRTTGEKRREKSYRARVYRAKQARRMQNRVKE